MASLLRTLTRLYRYTTLKKKLVLVNSFLFLLCGVLLYCGPYSYSAKVMQRQVEGSLASVAEQSAARINDQLTGMVTLSDILAIDRNFHSLFRQAGVDYLYQIRAYWEIRERLDSLISYYSENDAKIFLFEENLLSADGVILHPMSVIQAESWYESCLAQAGAPYWIGDTSYALNNRHFESVSVSRLFYDRNTRNAEPLGIIQISMARVRLEEILRSALPQGDIFQCLVDREGGLMAGDMQGLSLPPPPAPGGGSLQWEGYHLIYRPLTINGWQVVSVIPREYFQSHLRGTQQMYVLIMALLLLLIVLFAIITSNQLTRRARGIRRVLKDIENQNFSHKLTTPFRDEFSAVEVRINVFIDRIQRLMDEHAAIASDKRQAEIRALQEQINPHFIYNTLDSINWMAVEANQMHISSIITKLGRFLRLSLSGGRDMVSVREALAHIQLYIDIHQSRLDNMLTVRYDIDSRAENMAMIKLLLQPLVENAILHGFLEAGAAQGTLLISARLEEGSVVVSVEDDGAGFDARAAELHGQSYGLFSIRQRLKLYYADQAELSILSSPGRGTVATLRWPAMPYTEEE